MSSYIVSDKHINTLISWAGGHGVWFESKYVSERPAELAQLLYAANVKSVNERYDDENDDAFTFQHIKVDLPALHICSLANGLEYQCVDASNYEGSRADQLIRAIKDKAVRDIPGYDDAPWSIT
jgi:hypothetical protein